MSVPAIVRLALGLVLACGAAAQSAEQGKAEQSKKVVYQTDFEGADALAAWQPAQEAQLRRAAGSPNTRSLVVERPAAEGPGSRMVRTPLPLEDLRGARLLVEARVKAENVAKPPQAYNGVKCMLRVVSPDGGQWLQQNNLFGTFDWKPVRFIANVPTDATEAWLMLGLEATTGRVWFDQVRVTVIGQRRRAPSTPPAGAPYKGHDLPRLRGAMIGPRVTEADLRVLGAEWKANHVRWQLIWGGFPRSPADQADVAAYQTWLDSALERLDGLLPVCREVGIKVLIDLHTPPGGRNAESECRMFHEARFQQAFAEVWEKIARRYRGNTTVWGYDLVNEPVEGVVGEGLLGWQELAASVAKRVRAIDADHAIIIEPAPWGSPQSLDFFQPVDVPGVVYSVHMYLPHRFTHQGVYENPVGVSYPGEIEGKHWDRANLRAPWSRSSPFNATTTYISTWASSARFAGRRGKARKSTSAT